MKIYRELYQKNPKNPFRYPQVAAQDEQGVAQDDLYKKEPAIRAAMHLAEEAHEGQPRKKINPDIPYIIHPIMAHDILKQMGETNVHLLAAAFLHDVREDCESYQGLQGQKALLDDLKRELQKEGMGAAQAAQSAETIAHLVEQVTNPDPEDRRESKALTQIAHGIRMDPLAQRLKVADQTASLVDHLMQANASSIRPQDTTKFAEKARGVVREITDAAAPDDEEPMARYREMFLRIYERNDELLKTRDAAKQEKIRAQFCADIEAIFDIPQKVEKATAKEWPEIRRELPILKRRPTKADEAQYQGDFDGKPAFGGLAQVDYNDKGEVIGFMVWSAPHAAPNHYRNKMAQRLIERLEHLHSPLTVGNIDNEELREVLLEDGTTIKEGRYYRINQPMSAEVFAEAAFMSGCCTGGKDRQKDDWKGDQKKIADLGKELQFSFYSLDPPNNNRTYRT